MSRRSDFRMAQWMSSWRSEEHTSELQSQSNLVCRLLLEKKKTSHQNGIGEGRYNVNHLIIVNYDLQFLFTETISFVYLKSHDSTNVWIMKSRVNRKSMRR